MRSRAFRSVVGSLALVSLAIAVGACATGHTKPVDPSIVPKLAGKWTGFVTGRSGASAPATMNIQPDGSYRIVIVQPDIVATGKVSVVDGQLVLNNTGLTGPAVDLAPATAALDLSERGGQMALTGFGNNSAGPFSISFHRQP
jgi:hypothetical protein